MHLLDYDGWEKILAAFLHERSIAPPCSLSNYRVDLVAELGDSHLALSDFAQGAEYIVPVRGPDTDENPSQQRS